MISSTVSGERFEYFRILGKISENVQMHMIPEAFGAGLTLIVSYAVELLGRRRFGVSRIHRIMGEWAGFGIYVLNIGHWYMQ
jgi:hypothetical protein